MGTLYRHSEGALVEAWGWGCAGAEESSPPMDAALSFGCHLTWPELRPVAADRQTLSREEAILAAEDWDFQDRPTYYTAVRNLQGFIAYRLNKHEAAQAFFADVLAKDPDNVNAMGNLALLREKLFELDEARKYREQLGQLLARPSYAQRARAYADRAHAIRYFEQSKRCFRYMRFVERAATIGRRCSGPERAEWLFDYALALYRRDVQMLYLRKLAGAEMDEDGSCPPSSPPPPPHHQPHSDCYSDEKIREGFLKASRIFFEVIQTSSSADYRALSWVFLGILVNHDPERRSLALAFTDDEEEIDAERRDVGRLTPGECYAKGLAIRPDHPIVLRRVGAEYVKLGRFAEARGLLDKSLAACPSQFGHRHRGVMHLAMYERADAERQRTDEARGWLRKAARDFQEALSLKEFHADFSDLGHVYFLLGETGMALVKFQQAVSSGQDDYFDPVLTHLRWARCLEAKGQLEGCRLQREQALRARDQILATPLGGGEAELGEAAAADYFSQDFQHYSTEERPGWVPILRDQHFWAGASEPLSSPAEEPPATRALGGGGSGPRRRRHRYDFLVWHAERDGRWAAALLHKLESEQGLAGCLPRRDFVAGREVASEILRCLRESHRCLLVLTPRAGGQGLGAGTEDGSGWDSFVLSHAVRETSRRDGEYLVPVKLRRCSVPDLIVNVTVLECHEGQIRTEHWQQLVDKLCQTG